MRICSTARAISPFGAEWPRRAGADLSQTMENEADMGKNPTAKAAKPAAGKAGDKGRDIALAPAMTRHICACGCGKFSSVKELRPVRSIGVGHARMVYYIAGHEVRPRQV